MFGLVAGAVLAETDGAVTDLRTAQQSIQRSNQSRRKMTRLMKEWTEDDSEAMFRQSSDTSIDNHRPRAVDNSEEARRRRRFPFEAKAADARESRQSMPGDQDDHR